MIIRFPQRTRWQVPGDRMGYAPPPGVRSAAQVVATGDVLLEDGGKDLLQSGGAELLEQGDVATPGDVLLEDGGAGLLEGGGKELLEGGGGLGLDVLHEDDSRDLLESGSATQVEGARPIVTGDVLDEDGGQDLLEDGGRTELESAPATGDVLDEDGGADLLEDGGKTELESNIPTVDLGRFRLGDSVPIVFRPGGAAVAIAAPTASVYSPGGSLVETVPLYSHDGGLTFRAGRLLGDLYGAGTYTVVASFSYQGSQVTGTQQLELVGGGDPSGAIISLYEHEGADGRAVIAQTAAGILLQGNDPWA